MTKHKIIKNCYHRFAKNSQAVRNDVVRKMKRKEIIVALQNERKPGFKYSLRKSY